MSAGGRSWWGWPAWWGCWPATGASPRWRQPWKRWVRPWDGRSRASPRRSGRAAPERPGIWDPTPGPATGGRRCANAGAARFPRWLATPRRPGASGSRSGPGPWSGSWRRLKHGSSGRVPSAASTCPRSLPALASWRTPGPLSAWWSGAAPWPLIWPGRWRLGRRQPGRRPSVRRSSRPGGWPGWRTMPPTCW